MLAAKLNSCEWYRVTTWGNMRCSNPGDEYSNNDYSESDFDNYVEILFREFAEKIKVQYSEVRDILYGHNIEFFQEKAHYFSDYDSMGASEDAFESLTNKLLLPSVYEFEDMSTVQAFLDSFEHLELKDKVEILERLASAKLELGVVPNNSMGNVISDLSEQSKYQLVKSVFDAQIRLDVELK